MDDRGTGRGNGGEAPTTTTIRGGRQTSKSGSIKCVCPVCGAIIQATNLRSKIYTIACLTLRWMTSMATMRMAMATEHMKSPYQAKRYYDKKGLLPFVERSAGKARMFKDSDLDWLRLIGCLKLSGMSIKDIKQFIDWYLEGDSTLNKRRDMFYDRKQAVETQIETLQKTLSYVKYKCWYYDTSVADGTAQVHQHMNPEDIPQEVREDSDKLRTDSNGKFTSFDTAFAVYFRMRIV